MSKAQRHFLDAAGMWSLLVVAALFGAVRQGTFDWSSMSAGVGAGAVMVNLIEFRHAKRPAVERDTETET